MNQEEFRKVFDSLTADTIVEECTILSELDTTVDFFEYIMTDPKRLLAIIHFCELEDRYGIHVLFNEHDRMVIVFMLAGNVYHTSALFDVVSNDSVFDSFVNMVQLVLADYKDVLQEQEEKSIKEIEKHLQDQSAKVRWYNLYHEIVEQVDQVKPQSEQSDKVEQVSSESFEVLKGERCSACTLFTLALIGLGVIGAIAIKLNY